ncbi:MAG TPA: pentapeptide repeat-containing protein, partial [Acidimicrobiales bacterium]|nr:pentapeptide repeat-containing protein [Acidimicrobiales bacterium]
MDVLVADGLRTRQKALRGLVTVGAVLAASIGMGLATATPAFGDTVVDGCTIVSHPTPHRFTDCPSANLAGADLSGLDLSYADLAGANLSGALLSSAELRDADLSGAALTTCAFLEPPLGDFTCEIANLSAADLPFANLTGAQLSGVNLADDDLKHVDLSDSTLVSYCLPPGLAPTGCVAANLSGVSAPDANMANAGTSSCLTIDEGGDIGDASFCAGVIMSNADLSDATFTGDNLSWASLAGARLVGATFNGATFNECAPSNPDVPVCSA